MSHSWLGDVCPWNEETVRFPFVVSTVPTLGENMGPLVEEEPGPVLVLAWLLGSGMNLFPIEDLVFLFLQVLIL